MEPLNAILHQPVRTQLVAFLVARDSATFKELKETLNITDGNLDAHLKELLGESYIRSKKSMTSGRQQTFYSITKKGEQAFREYVQTLHLLLHMEEIK